jgi:hypothetical protein
MQVEASAACCVLQVSQDPPVEREHVTANVNVQPSSCAVIINLIAQPPTPTTILETERQ